MPAALAYRTSRVEGVCLVGHKPTINAKQRTLPR
jgi:hypothetical protein